MVIRMLKEFSENYNSMKKDIETITKRVVNEKYNIWNEEYTRRNKPGVSNSFSMGTTSALQLPPNKYIG